MATKKLIPEPSQRLIIWLAAFAAVAFCAILVYDYATGDPRMAWSRAHNSEAARLQKVRLRRRLQTARPAPADDERTGHCRQPDRARAIRPADDCSYPLQKFQERRLVSDDTCLSSR